MTFESSGPNTNEPQPRIGLPRLPVHMPLFRWVRRGVARGVKSVIRPQHRHRRESVAGFDLLIWPTVFSPRLFRSGAVLAEVVERELTRQQTGIKMLDLGTGSGIIGLVAARAGAFVTAVDINSAAVRCANHNAVRSGLEGRMTCLQGDLWDAINGMTFDLIVFNPPFFRGEPRGPFEYAWCSTDVFERFSAGLDAHLAPLGSCLLLLSSDGDCESLLTRLTRNNWRIELVHECKGWTESQSIFRLSRSS